MKKIVLCFAAAILSSRADSAPSVRGGDWPAYGHDAGGGRFSPLTQITPKNVAGLQIAWTYHMNPAPVVAQARAPASTNTPLVVDGVLYLGTPYARVVALDATTGSQEWAYQLPVGDQPAARGLSYWPGDKAHAPRIIFGTTAGGATFIGGTDDQRFRAFDSGTGKELWNAKLDYSAHATPITWQGKDSRQYVGVVATGGSYLNSPTGGDSLVVWALPNQPGGE